MAYDEFFCNFGIFECEHVSKKKEKLDLQCNFCHPCHHTTVKLDIYDTQLILIKITEKATNWICSLSLNKKHMNNVWLDNAVRVFFFFVPDFLAFSVLYVFFGGCLYEKHLRYRLAFDTTKRKKGWRYSAVNCRRFEMRISRRFWEDLKKMLKEDFISVDVNKWRQGIITS